MQTIKLIRANGGPMEIWTADYIRSEHADHGGFTVFLDTENGTEQVDIHRGDVAYIMTGPDTTHVLRPKEWSHE